MPNQEPALTNVRDIYKLADFASFEVLQLPQRERHGVAELARSLLSRVLDLGASVLVLLNEEEYCYATFLDASCEPIETYEFRSSLFVGINEALQLPLPDSFSFSWEDPSLQFLVGRSGDQWYVAPMQFQPSAEEPDYITVSIIPMPSAWHLMPAAEAG